jgi:hypothetical protein
MVAVAAIEEWIAQGRMLKEEDIVGIVVAVVVVVGIVKGPRGEVALVEMIMKMMKMILVEEMGMAKKMMVRVILMMKVVA